MNARVANIRLPAVIGVVAFAVAWVAAGGATAWFDYSHRIACCLLEGRLGLAEPPPSWLNEVVPLDGSHYSVFPLGAVLSVLPLSLLVHAGLLEEFPVRFLIAALGAGITVLAYLLTLRVQLPAWRRVLFAAVPFFGSCLWPNLSFGGAWQLSLGFSVAGLLVTLVCTLVRPMPLLAGVGFAVAFGNRTEVLLVAPLFYYLIRHAEPERWRRGFVRFSLARWRLAC